MDLPSRSRLALTCSIGSLVDQRGFLLDDRFQLGVEMLRCDFRRIRSAGLPNQLGGTALDATTVEAHYAAGVVEPSTLVPEPSTFALAALGLLGLAACARRRRK